MESNFGQHQQARQLPRMIPEQIIAGEILQMPRQELEQRILTEFEQNPALVLEEVGLCPMCENPVNRYPCPSCGYTPPTPEEEIPIVMADDWQSYQDHLIEGEDLEPFGGIAALETLSDYLHGQWSVVATDDDREVGEYLIDLLDEEGYLVDPLIEIADHFKWSVPQVEAVLFRVQELEPAGVGARNLKECLFIQWNRVEEETEPHELAGRILTECWDDLTAHRWNRIADQLAVEIDEIEEAAEWIRHHLAPYPGSSYRTAWEHLAPSKEPGIIPDVVIRRGPEGFIIEIVETHQLQIGIDPQYQSLNKALGRKNDKTSSEFDHIRRSVANARFIIDAIAQRRRTLYHVMKAVAEEQSDFLLYGKAHLKALMQKTIAARIGIHESTVCRALADKMVRIPSGETVPTCLFFDASTPVKEALQELIGKEDRAKPLSDSRLAQLLTDQGYKIARRTVAKYREALRIPSVEMRQTGRI